ncbi:hypothetical protein ACTJKN_05270 [Pedobacter sp. 22163]|uniref:hypothetical protein n=1 Tax=Pedobacter sp. 22163 TaxID=3453883 RepID=UPI003F85FADC
MKYLIRITNTYNTHNSLEREVQEFLKAIDRTLIRSEYIENLKSGISDEISRLSKENKRCKTISTHWYKSGTEDQDWSMFLTGICGLTLLHVNDRHLAIRAKGEASFLYATSRQDETASET